MSAVDPERHALLHQRLQDADAAFEADKAARRVPLYEVTPDGDTLKGDNPYEETQVPTAEELRQRRALLLSNHKQRPRTRRPSSSSIPTDAPPQFPATDLRARIANTYGVEETSWAIAHTTSTDEAEVLFESSLENIRDSLNDERAAISGFLEERLAALWAQNDLLRARLLIETLLRVGKAAYASEADKHRRLRRGNAAVRNRILWAERAGHDLLLWLGFELSQLENEYVLDKAAARSYAMDWKLTLLEERLANMPVIETDSTSSSSSSNSSSSVDAGMMSEAPQTPHRDTTGSDNDARLPLPSSTRALSPPPNDFCCPISTELMDDCVLLVASGHSYERKCIEAWLMRHDTDPITGVLLNGFMGKILVPNHSLRKAIEDWKQRKREEGKKRGMETTG